MLSKIKSQYTNNSFLRFGIHAAALYILWLFVYQTWGLPRNGLDDKATELVGEASLMVGRYFGYEAESQWGRNWRKEQAIEEANREVVTVKESLVYQLYLDGKKSILIANSCNGLLITALYIGFIIAYPGRWKPKIVFIILGSILIFALNVTRIIALAINWDYYRETFSFNHKYTYVFLVYSVVFLLWMNWVNKYSITAKVAKA